MADSQLPEFEWTVVTDTTDGDIRSVILAAYYRNSPHIDGVLEFVNVNHKIVAAFPLSRVSVVVRGDKVAE